MSTETTPERLAIVGIGGKPGSGTASLALILAHHIGTARCVIVAADEYGASQQVDSLLLRIRELRAHRAEPSGSHLDRIIFVEGVLTLALASLRKLCDVTVFLDLPEIIREERLGSGEPQAQRQALAHHALATDPTTHELEEISARQADITVDGASLSALDGTILWGAIRAAL